MSGRAAVVQSIEQAGIVAVIRMKEPDKLRAVVDAIAEGGIRALEVTMTIYGHVMIDAQREALAGMDALLTD